MQSANFVPHIWEVFLILLRWKGMPANINSSPLKRMHQKGKEGRFETSKFDFIFVCWLVSGWYEWLTSDVNRTWWTICDTEMYGFILQAVELPLSCGSFVMFCEDDLRFLWLRSLRAHCIGDALTLLDRVSAFFRSEDCLVILSTMKLWTFFWLPAKQRSVCLQILRKGCSHFSSESPIC